MNIWRSIIDLILPPRCVMCGQIMDTDKGICDECIEKIEFLKAPVCYHCGQPLIGVSQQSSLHLLCGNCLNKKRKIFRFSRSAFAYDDFSKKLILDFKFYDRTDLAPELAKMLLVAGEDIFKAGVDIMVPVPLHYTRLIKRKYNQSALLAKELGKLTGIEVDNFSLYKKRPTKPQVECSGAARLHNLKGAFELKNNEKFEGKKVLLIDDVMTTGSTLKECTSILKKAKVKSIDALTVARVL